MEDIIVRTSATTPNIPGIVPFPLNFDDNAGSASSQGMEVELRGVLSDAWSWAMGGSFHVESGHRQRIDRQQRRASRAPPPWACSPATACLLHRSSPASLR